MALTPPVEPMLARAVSRLPGPGALPGGVMFEPKYDGFRVIVFAGPEGVFLQSRNQRDLTRAFPEVATAAERLGESVVLDGEAVIFNEGRLDFPALQERMNRRPRTVADLARKHPASFIAFDLLSRQDTVLLARPYRERRAALESLFRDHGLGAPWALTPATDDPQQAQRWLRGWGAVGVEGALCKGAGQSYQPGRRGWLKVRARDTAEAVVGAVVGSLRHPSGLLLGRYTDVGRLRLVARTTALPSRLRDEVSRTLKAAGPGHPWARMRVSATWGSREPLEFGCVEPDRVVEFDGDTSVDQGRWRHPVRAVRFRADMAPADVPRSGEGGPSGAA